MRPVADYQSQYIEIIALPIGHVFDEVDCAEEGGESWSTARWREWKQAPIFREFIEPARNVLLKEFQGGSSFETTSSTPSPLYWIQAYPAASRMLHRSMPQNFEIPRANLSCRKFARLWHFGTECLSQAEAELPRAT
jgi:hypothetical protein